MKESMQGRSSSSWNMMSMVQMWQGLSYRNMVSLSQKISGMGMMQEHWKLFQNICRRKGFLWKDLCRNWNRMNWHIRLTIGILQSREQRKAMIIPFMLWITMRSTAVPMTILIFLCSRQWKIFWKMKKCPWKMQFPLTMRIWWQKWKKQANGRCSWHSY